MKRIIFIVIVLLLSSLTSFSQKIISMKQEIKELKELNLKYTQIVIEVPDGYMYVGIETDLEGYWRLLR